MRRPFFHLAIVSLALAVALAGCAGRQHVGRTPASIYGPGPGGSYQIGKPYKINGTWYYPAENPAYDSVGLASWYGPGFHGRSTANGEVFDTRRMTAAHTTLPLPVLVRVTNLENGRSTLVRVNDRGPFVPGRIIDLSEAAAHALEFRGQGLVPVRVQFVGRADGQPTVAAVPVEPDRGPTGAVPMSENEPAGARTALTP